MTNWLVPAIWALGFVYALYVLLTDPEIQERIQVFGDFAKIAMEDDPGKAMLVVLLVMALLIILALCWPIIEIFDFGQFIYRLIKGEKHEIK